MGFTVYEIAQLIEGDILGNPTLQINNLCKIQEAIPGSVTFLANPGYEKYLYITRASAVIINKNFKPAYPISASLILVEDPYVGFAKLLSKYQSLLAVSKIGVEEPSYLGSHADVGEGGYRGAFSYIGEYVQLGKYVQVYPHAYIGDRVVVGENTIIYSGVKIYAGCEIGKNCIIHAGAVIGSDGFGFAPQVTGSYQKIPQIGNVVLEDDIEIGANTTVDRATMGTTRIQAGTKIDNLVQIAHNVEIGKDTVIAALTGIAGSAKVGDNCILGGQVGITGHTEMGNNTIVAGQAGVTKSYKSGDITLMGMPAMERKKFLKSYAFFRQLHNLFSITKS